MINENTLSLLTLQLNHIKQLELLLNDEKQSLIDRDHESITSLANHKQLLMSQLEKIDSDISASMTTTQLSDEEQLLKEQITAALSNCHRLNLENGKAIDLSINSVQRLQRSLIQKRAGNSMTYNAKGKTRGGSASSGYISA